MRQQFEAPEQSENHTVGHLHRTIEESIAAPVAEALLQARQGLEAILSGNGTGSTWQRLLADEGTDRSPGTNGPDTTKNGLMGALCADPAFKALQFIDAALACLADARRADLIEARPRDTEIDADRTALVPAEISAAHEGVLQPPAGNGLATRIPVLLANERQPPRTGALRTSPHHDSIEHRLALLNSAGAETGSKAETPGPVEIANAATPMRPDPELSEPIATRFQAEAIGIPEASVQIVVRRPGKTVLDARLPPLPFANLTLELGGTASRNNRATPVKWIDPADGAEASAFRPVGSAMDEAQVSIIAKSDQSPAQMRNERRALGIAPDREDRMRRFLSALSPDPSPRK